MLVKYVIRLLLVSVVFTGCMLPPGQHIDNIWFFTYYTDKNAEKNGLLTPASFLNLQKDGSYTSDFGEFEYGVWKSDNKTLYLNDYRNKITAIKVEYLSGNEMRISSEHIPAASFES